MGSFGDDLLGKQAHMSFDQYMKAIVRHTLTQIAKNNKEFQDFAFNTNYDYMMVLKNRAKRIEKWTGKDITELETYKTFIELIKIGGEMDATFGKSRNVMPLDPNSRAILKNASFIPEYNDQDEQQEQPGITISKKPQSYKPTYTEHERRALNEKSQNNIKKSLELESLTEQKEILKNNKKRIENPDDTPENEQGQR